MTAAVIFSLDPRMLRYWLAEKPGRMPPKAMAAEAAEVFWIKLLLERLMREGLKIE
jgi:hypothetical protein